MDPYEATVRKEEQIASATKFSDVYLIFLNSRCLEKNLSYDETVAPQARNFRDL